MARQNPASFAFGMLFEIAAVVVIVSLLPRFDLRPQTAASEPESSSFSTRLGELTAPPREEVVIPTSFARSEEPRNSLVFTEPKFSQQLSAQDVENRLDRASQGLVNSLGSAAASAANEVLYSAGRPALPAPTQPSFPTVEATPPSFTYLPPRTTADTWAAARPTESVEAITPIQTQQPLFGSQPRATTPRTPNRHEPPSTTQTPRRWRNY